MKLKRLIKMEKKLLFIDSAKFMASSILSLVTNLAARI